MIDAIHIPGVLNWRKLYENNIPKYTPEQQLTAEIA